MTAQYRSSKETSFQTTSVFTNFDSKLGPIEEPFETEGKKEQHEKRLNWRRKINDRCKAITIPKIRPPTFNPTLTSEMLQSEKFFHLRKWVNKERYDLLIYS